MNTQMLDNHSALPAGAARMAERWMQQEERYGLIFLDADGQIVALTPAAQKLLGYQGSELIGKHVAAIFTRGDQALQLPLHELQVAAKIGFSEDDRWHRRKDGSLVWIGGSMSRLDDPSGRTCGFVKIMRDQTERRTQLEALVNRATLRQSSQSEQADLVRMLAHELANSLGVVSNVTYLLPKVAAEARAKLFDSLQSQTRLLSQLLDDLRHSVPPARHAVNARPVQLQAALRGVVDACAPLAQARLLELQLLAPQGVIEFMADPDKFHQIVLNVTSHAINSTPSGGNVWVNATTEGGAVVVRVEDDGEGLSSDELEQLSAMFVHDVARHGAGTDARRLGLEAAHELVVLHGGTIEARSDGPGRGSAFSVRLPLTLSGKPV